jgi:tRNA nucleotidyltransferase/poly(A) polymerase
MPDYIYLLENRLSPDQQHALRCLREAAREVGMIHFLTGDAVRDLTSGHAVRDLEVAVHGNALKLKKTIEKLGGTVWGEDEASRSLYLCFPGTVRVDVVSTQRVELAKVGHPVYHPASIQEELRRRDFTVNAMAISLNEGSFGLLMDPMNGAADIETRTLRLVSNYGFIEHPSLLIRATRYQARLGWELDPKTRTRYDNAKNDEVIQYLTATERSSELEQIGHEDEGLKVLRALEEEGWMQVLFPAWTSAKADEEKLKTLHEQAVELLLQGVHADMSAAQMQLLTSKLAAKDLAALKSLMLRPGFVEEWNSLDALAASFSKALLAKDNATPSASYRLFTSFDPEAILWLGFTTHDKAVKERYQLFLKTWPEVRQRIPHALLNEMRITAELAGYREIVHSLFLELIDGRLTTTEEIKAFLEPHSPPPPPVKETVKRPRAKRGEAKIKEDSFDDDEDSDDLDDDDDLDDLGADDDDLGLGTNLPKIGRDLDLDGDLDSDDDKDDKMDADLDEDEPVKPVAKAAKSKPVIPIKTENPTAKPVPAVKPATVPKAAVTKVEPAVHAVAQKAAHAHVEPVKTKPVPVAKAAVAKVEPVVHAVRPKAAHVHVAPVKTRPVPPAKPVAKVAAKAKPIPAKPAVHGKHEAVKVAVHSSATHTKPVPAKTAGHKTAAPAKQAAKAPAKTVAKAKPAVHAVPAAKSHKPAPKAAHGKPAKKH